MFQRLNPTAHVASHQCSMCFVVIRDRIADHPDIARPQDQGDALATDPAEDAAYSFFGLRIFCHLDAPARVSTKIAPPASRPQKAPPIP